jgi:hypothetical protein
MKEPYFDYWQRVMIRQDTFTGAGLLLHLAWMKLKRELYRTIRELTLKTKFLTFAL